MDEKNKTAQNGQNNQNKAAGAQNRHGSHNYHNRHRPRKPRNDIGDKPQTASPLADEVKERTEGSETQLPAPAQRPSQKPNRDRRHQPNHQNQNRPQAQTEAKESDSQASPNAPRQPRQGAQRRPRIPEHRQKSPTPPGIVPEVIFLDTPIEEAEPSIPESAVKVGAPDLDLFNQPESRPVVDPDQSMVEVVGVRFRRVGKVYYFDPRDIKVQHGDFVIVETARGPEYGEVCLANRLVAEKDTVQPLRPVIRVATKEDAEHNENNRRLEKDAFSLCLEKIAKHKLEMKLVEAQYTFDNSKLLFYFTAAGRVDFRELVKDLASVFRTRIELRQIGIRDEAKLLGGLGACGRTLCCASFLSDFVQVSIKMAKEQNLSLNSNKISGACGRLMCCLRYENDTYEEEIRRTPPVDSTVRTPDGVGTVTEISPLSGFIKVRLPDDAGIKSYHRDNVTVLSRGKSTLDIPENEDEEK